MKVVKKMLAFLLSLTLIFTSLPMMVFADGEESGGTTENQSNQEEQPAVNTGDVVFIKGNTPDGGVVKYSVDNKQSWMEVSNNQVVSDIEDQTVVYVQYITSEGYKLDDYVDNGISANNINDGESTTSLVFDEECVTSFTYDKSKTYSITICFMQDNGGNQGDPVDQPQLNTGDVLFIKGNEQEGGVVKYSVDNKQSWTEVSNNQVVSDIEDQTVVYVQYITSEGYKLDDYVDNGISANNINDGENTTSLNFDEECITSFTYDKSKTYSITIRFMQDNGGGGGTTQTGNLDVDVTITYYNLVTRYEYKYDEHGEKIPVCDDAGQYFYNGNDGHNYVLLTEKRTENGITFLSFKEAYEDENAESGISYNSVDIIKQETDGVLYFAQRTVDENAIESWNWVALSGSVTFENSNFYYSGQTEATVMETKDAEENSSYISLDIYALEDPENDPALYDFELIQEYEVDETKPYETIEPLDNPYQIEAMRINGFEMFPDNRGCATVEKGGYALDDVENKNILEFHDCLGSLTDSAYLVNITYDANNEITGYTKIEGTDFVFNKADENDEKWELQAEPNDHYDIVLIQGTSDVFTVIWTTDYDTADKWNDGVEGGDFDYEMYVANGYIDLLKVVRTEEDAEGNPQENILFDATDPENIIDSGEVGGVSDDKSFGHIILRRGDNVTLKLVPNYGYQLATIGGQEVDDMGLEADATGEISTFTINDVQNNIHFSSIFVYVDNMVQMSENSTSINDVVYDVTGEPVKSGTLNMVVEEVTPDVDGAIVAVDIGLQNVITDRNGDVVDNWTTQITEMNESSADVSLSIDGISADKEYIVQREHTAQDGKTYTDYIEARVSEDGLITFSTDRFSKYTILENNKLTVDCQIIDVNGQDIPEEKIDTPVSGTGEYDKGSDATLVAPDIEGYNFAGWYMYDPEEECKFTGEPLSTSKTVILTVNNNLSCVAVYEYNGFASITVIGGVDFTINNESKTGTDTADYDIGKDITVYCNDENFEYWKNGYNIIKSRDRGYTFTVTGDETLEAVFSEKVEEKVELVFESLYNQEMARTQLGAKDTFECPVIPTRYGYTALGWDFDGDGVYDKDKDTLEAAIEIGLTTEDKKVVIMPLYVLNENSYDITVINGSGTGTYKQNDVVTVTAQEAPDGQKFSGWEDDKGNVLDYNETYSFYAAESLTIKAVYVDLEVQVEETGVTDIVDTYADADNKKLTFVSMSTVPDGCIIKKAGIIATKNESIGTDKDNFNASTATYVRGNEWSGTGYRYTWTIGKVKAGETWYVRAYLVYVDMEGNIHTVYGDVVSNSL